MMQMHGESPKPVHARSLKQATGQLSDESRHSPKNTATITARVT